MTINVTLSPALEAFARERVESGEYASIEDVVRDALALLQEQAEARVAFADMLRAAREEADRDGTFTLEEVLAAMDAEIDAVRRDR